MHHPSIQERLKTDLQSARKSRDRLKTAVLRSTLALISNAEAVPVEEISEAYTMHIGVGSSEVMRRTLTEQDIRQIIQNEIDELLDAVSGMGANSDNPYTTELLQKASILKKYLTT
jgi:uncharacterized protein